MLLKMGNKYGQHDKSGQLQMDLRRKDLAQLAGTTVSTTIRALAQFEKYGWINVNYHTITFLDEGALQSFSSV